MNRTIYYLSLILVLTLVGCGAQDVASSSDDAVEKRVDVRYGINTDGYKLKYSEVRAGQTMGDIMTSFGRTARDIDRVDRASKPIFPLNRLKTGDRYVAFLGRDSLGREHLDYLVYEQDPLNYVRFVMMDDSVSVHMGKKPITTKTQRGVAVIESSIWSALMKLRVPYTLGEELEDIYSGSVDFFGIRKGDCFTLIYDEKFVDDSVSVGVAGVRAVKFTHRERPYYAIAYQQGGRMEFWDETGASLHKTMFKAPLRYSRISSRYSNSKAHPVYKIYKNKAVEYAAPTGTSVHAVADGVVTYCGVGGDEGGNSIKIGHSDGVVTEYNNLRRFVRGVGRGDRVSQGDIIGYVGVSESTKESYLDYRAWVNEEETNPHSISQKSLRMIAEPSREAYNRLAKEMVRVLDSVERSVVERKL